METAVFQKLWGPYNPWLSWYIPRWLVHGFVLKMVRSSGMGRHTFDEIQHIGREDVKAVRTQLGMICSL